MIEGIPGSGKSTTAQFVSQIMLHKGYSHKWWYEEEQGHPVYIYDDYNTMQKIVDDLSSGKYHHVINRALKRWQEFVASVQSSSDIIIVDSCLFGYLTWSLFPYNVTKLEIMQYVKDVEQIIKPLNPQLIYFYQTDVGTALKKICIRRGGDTEESFVRAATQSLYGKTLGLSGFEGMVTYWRNYRKITDEAFKGLDCPKIAIENTEEKWSLYGRQIFEFLGINQVAEGTMVQQNLQRLVGLYLAETDGIPDCSIQIESGNLIVNGLPQVWTRSKLIPLSFNVFQVQSLPFEVRFVEDGSIHMSLTGPTLLEGPVDYKFTKKS
jgi:thymidylate kinase